jgi:hypothetical protein
MPDKSPIVERGILVFAIWAVFGFLGLGLFLEGMARDVWGLAAVGVGVVVLAFVGHIIVNGVFDTGFTPGETALGIGTYGLLGLLFVVGALRGGMTMADFHAGLTFFGTLATGFLAYLFTRHGLRGAFSRFHVQRDGLHGKGAR